MVKKEEVGIVRIQKLTGRPSKLGFRSLGVAWWDPGQLPVASLEYNEAVLGGICNGVGLDKC